MKLYDNQWIYGNVNNFSREHEDYTTIINHQVLVGAAEPLDKNGLRIVQPTLGFLSAMEGTLKFHRTKDRRIYERTQPFDQYQRRSWKLQFNNRWGTIFFQSRLFWG